MKNVAPEEQPNKIKELLIQSKTVEAITCCLDILKRQPDNVALSILLSQAYQQNTEFDKMLSCIVESDKINNDNLLIKLRLVECFLYAGETAKAILQLNELEQKKIQNDQFYAKLAELYLHCGQHEKVVQCYQHANELCPEKFSYQYNLASALMSMGEFYQAESLLETVIKNKPGDLDAYYSRSVISKKNSINNHVNELELLIKKYQNPQADIALGYALAKELEDIGDYEKSFKYLQMAAAQRRKKMQYQVKTDVEALDKIRKVFDRKSLVESKVSNSEYAPIFILGLPRSGTTLLERILSSHSEVGSLGEINNFAFSLMHTVGPNSGKLDLIEKSTTIDFDLLAQRYTHATMGYGVSGKHLIDKTPLNFLYLGLIKQAFPKANIIHLKRHPLDSCYAMFKTLFRMGYPFSYEYNDLAEYYCAYNDLMNHWRELYPEGFLDIEYHDLVNSPQKEVRRLVQYCELDWQHKMMDFHQNSTPTATASFSQVRQPIYKTSVNRWKRYELQLKPLQDKLTNRGINCE